METYELDDVAALMKSVMDDSDHVGLRRYLFQIQNRIALLFDTACAANTPLRLRTMTSTAG
jgi:hypothetical protein